MVNTHDIARLRNLNTSFRIAMNDILCDTNSAHGMGKCVGLSAVTSSLISNYRQPGMTGLAVSILTSWAGILDVKKFGGNACTFLYLLLEDKACNTICFTRL